MKLISVKDSLGKEYSGEFNSVRDAYEYYQDELDDNKIIISKAYLELPEIKKFAEWYSEENEIDSHYESEVVEYGYDEDGTYRTASGIILILDNLPIIFENEAYQDLFEMEIKNIIKEREKL